MDEAKRDLVQQWLTIAWNDLDVAQFLGPKKVEYSEIAAFHCQQAAEKALKAYLVFNDQRFPKTHNLLALVQLAESFEPSFANWQHDADNLTEFAVENRYPDTFRVLPKPELDQALHSAAGIYDFVLSLIPEEAHPNLGQTE